MKRNRRNEKGFWELMDYFKRGSWGSPRGTEKAKLGSEKELSYEEKSEKVNETGEEEKSLTNPKGEKERRTSKWNRNRKTWKGKR